MRPGLRKDVRFDEPCVAGIDEAGRGPVLGPMVYAICYCPESRMEMVKGLGVADSKVLTAEKRDKILKTMEGHEHIGWEARSLSPEEISNSMLQKDKVNLNLLAHQTMVNIIRVVLSRSVKVTKVFIDTVGTPESLEKYLSRIFPSIQFKVSKKADSLYPIVSAASIIAKVNRDEELENWIFREKNTSDRISRHFGSGYPGDPVTIQWLKDHCDPVFGFPKIIRFSWSTAERLLEKEARIVHWPEEEEEGKNSRGNSAKANSMPEPKKVRITLLNSFSVQQRSEPRVGLPEPSPSFSPAAESLFSRMGLHRICL